MLKKFFVISFALSLVILCCSKKNITNNYYTSSDKGSIVGFVYPPNSQAKITATLGLEITSTSIDSSGYFELADLRPGTYSLTIEAEGYFDYLSKETLVSGGTTVSIDTVLLISVHDLIASVWPSDEAEEINLSTSIQIGFRKSMDKTSVENAFRIEPETEGNFVWYVRKNGSNDLYFVPYDLLVSNTLYRVTIDSTASDIEGVNLSKPFEFSFITEPIKILSTQPGNRETWVSSHTYVFIYFNTYMNSESVNSAFNMVDSHQEPIEGDFVWRYLRYFEFHPYTVLSSNQEYTVTVDSNALDIHGGKFPAPYQFSFTTEPLAILSTSPANHETWVAPNSTVRISFNTQMDAESVILAFKMVDSKLKDVTGDFDWGNSQTMFFHPTTILAFGETYTITIDTNAKDISGGSLEKPYNFWFKTRPY